MSKKHPKANPPGLYLPKGQLTEPIKLSDLPGTPLQYAFPEGVSDELVDRELAHLAKDHFDEKLLSLATLLDIDLFSNGGWKKLSLVLARAYIEGFQIEKLKNNIRSEWSHEAEKALVREIDLRKEKGVGIRQICRNLSDKGAVKKLDGTPFSAESLRRHYTNLEKSGVADWFREAIGLGEERKK